MVLQLIYTSRALFSVTPADASAILQTSQRHNPAHGITGALVHSDCFFAQLLEGDFGEVNALFRRIVADPRHSHITLLHYASTPKRACSGWAMHYLNDDSSLNRMLLRCGGLLGDEARAAEPLGRTLIEALARSGADLRPRRALAMREVPAEVRGIPGAMHQRQIGRSGLTLQR